MSVAVVSGLACFIPSTAAPIDACVPLQYCEYRVGCAVDPIDRNVNGFDVTPSASHNCRLSNAIDCKPISLKQTMQGNAVVGTVRGGRPQRALLDMKRVRPREVARACARTTRSREGTGP